MVKDLNMDIEIIAALSSEKDGLALSSRNAYLNNERKDALLYKSLKSAKI